MLRQIITTFETSPGPITLDALAQRMGVERGVLEAMLADLARIGRLVRVDGRAAAGCSACGHAKGCPFILAVTGVYYALPEAAAELRPGLGDFMDAC
jgi:hypothetical protein